MPIGTTKYSLKFNYLVPLYPCLWGQPYGGRSWKNREFYIKTSLSYELIWVHRFIRVLLLGYNFLKSNFFLGFYADGKEFETHFLKPSKKLDLGSKDLAKPTQNALRAHSIGYVLLHPWTWDLMNFFDVTYVSKSTNELWFRSVSPGPTEDESSETRVSRWIPKLYPEVKRVKTQPINTKKYLLRCCNFKRKGGFCLNIGTGRGIQYLFFDDRNDIQHWGQWTRRRNEEFFDCIASFRERCSQKFDSKNC